MALSLVGYAQPLVAEVLINPARSSTLCDEQWDLLVRQARSSYLLAKLAYQLSESHSAEAIAVPAQNHLKSAELMARRQKRSLEWELQCLQRELSATGSPIVLLKGAAYAAMGLRAARGRVFSDIDILVPKAQIGRVESELLIHGWASAELDHYDERYYRMWMHEIPPMRHRFRGVTIDVHHAILPETARCKVRTPLFFDRLEPVPGLSNFFVLGPVDMVLHSATHLFHEGEFDKGARDLFDLDTLLRDFGSRIDGFWTDLPERAKELGLGRPMFYALRYTQHLLGTPVPRETIQSMTECSPTLPIRSVMDACYERALRPVHPSCDVRGTALARMALYLRSHWIRMPLHLLIWHLGRKAWLRMFKTPDDVQQGPDAAAPVGQEPNQARHQQQ